MVPKEPQKLVVLDGRTGEGGGQLVRIATALSALTGTPIKITNVRGNRKGPCGGGLKAQHTTCVATLASFTNATVSGCSIGSKEFTFIPHKPPSELLNRNIQIDADTAASALLIFQAVFTFLLFASSSEGDEDTPITLTIRGGTNVTFSPSWEYLDQVLLPALERFGIKGVERRVGWRGWSHGRSEVGDVWIKFRPVKRGTALKAPEEDVFETPGRVEKINISLVVPKEIRTLLLDALKLELELVFPGIKTQVIVDEDSRHMSRIYVLLVAQTANGHHLGQDCLYSRSIKGKLLHQLATEVSQKVVDELDAEVRKCMCVDEHLQDQLVVFQALAGGRSYIGYGEDKDGKERMDRDDEPFGVGDMHAKTARWVVSQLLPEVKWRENGRACEGVGWKCEKSLEEELESLSLAEASTSSKKV